MNKRRTNCSPHGYSKSNGEEEVNEIIKRYNDANGDMAETEKELYGSYTVGTVPIVYEFAQYLFK